MSIEVTNPYKQITDKTGKPLDNGLIYIGEVGRNPEVYPIQVFYDEDYTLPVPQPIRTINGYFSRNGSPAKIFTKETKFSIMIKDKFKILQFSDLYASGAISGSGLSASDITGVVSYVESIADLIAIKNPKDGQVVFAESYYFGLGLGGDNFKYVASRENQNDGVNVFNGWVRQVPESYLNLHNAGARGDGVTNDFDAFKRIQEYMTSHYLNNNLKSFVVHFPTPQNFYSITTQTYITGVGFTAIAPLSVDYRDVGRSGGVWDDNLYIDMQIVLKSDNAIIRQSSGQYFGTFNKNTKAPLPTTAPLFPEDTDTQWQQYKDVITVAGLAHVMIFNRINLLYATGSLEIDGNRQNMIIGGQFGDSGWQSSAYGFVADSIRRISLNDINTHHHLNDCLYVAGITNPDNPDVPYPDTIATVSNCTATHSSRNSLAICGGTNVTFNDCTFDKGGTTDFIVSSLPAACVDIEAEVSKIRKLTFNNCYFGEGGNYSVTTFAGDISGVEFNLCKFVNPKSFAVWCNSPNLQFNHCYINGRVGNAYRTSIDSERTVYADCEFTDNPQQNEGIVPFPQIFDVRTSNPVIRRSVFNCYVASPIMDDGYTGTGTPCEVTDSVINIYGNGGAQPFTTGLYKNIEINDFRSDRTVLIPFHLDNALVSSFIVKSTDGVSNIQFYGVRKFTPNSVVTTLSSNPYLDISVKPFDFVADHSITSEVLNVNLLKKVAHNPTLTLLNIQYNVGDRIYCTDPELLIDYWVCTVAGVGIESKWKKVAAVMSNI